MHKTIEVHYEKNYKTWLRRAKFAMKNDQDGEDVTQDAYARALRYYDPDNPPLVFDNWFARIFFNAMNDHKKMKFGRSEEYEEEDQEGTPCNAYSAELVKDVYDFIASKPEEVRERLYLHFKYGYTSADIRAIVGGPAITTRQLLSRFRQEIREKFGED